MTTLDKKITTKYIIKLYNQQSLPIIIYDTIYYKLVLMQNMYVIISCVRKIHNLYSLF